MDNVEGDEVMRRAVVGDVERASVRRERDPVRLVELPRNGFELARDGVETVGGVGELRRRPEALQVSVARIGEPDRAVRANGDVVRRVERPAEH